jgi:hypothetical protein
MRFAAVVAVVLISVGMALAQKAKDPVVHVRPAPRVSAHGPAASPSATNSSAAELTRIEQETARKRLNKPVAHHSPGSSTATPALDLGKNKPIRVSRSPQPANPKATNNSGSPKLH